MSKYHEIAIALAGVCQSALLVPQLANSGTYNKNAYLIGVQSIFNTSPTSSTHVFGGQPNLKLGLETLITILSSGQKEQIEIIRYVFASLNIANKLRKNNDVLQQIANRMNRITTLYPALNHPFQSDDTQSQEALEEHIDEISYSLAGIYSDLISPITNKVKVMGKIEYLQNTLIQAKVRTALFAATRAATLWYQVGGNRLQFFFFRKKIILAARDLLAY